VNFAAAAVGSVPETASWAMFVAAFGLVGGTLRAQRSRRLSLA